MRSAIGRRLIRLCVWILCHSSDADLKAENMSVSTFLRDTGDTDKRGI